VTLQISDNCRAKATTLKVNPPASEFGPYNCRLSHTRVPLQLAATTLCQKRPASDSLPHNPSFCPPFGNFLQVDILCYST